MKIVAVYHGTALPAEALDLSCTSTSLLQLKQRVTSIVRERTGDPCTVRLYAAEDPESPAVPLPCNTGVLASVGLTDTDTVFAVILDSAEQA